MSISETISNFESRHENVIGYIYALLSTILLGSGNYFFKAALNPPSSQVVIYRAIQHVIYAYMFTSTQKLSFHFTDITVNRILLMRGFFGFLAITFNYYGLSLLPLSTSTVLLSIQPIFVGIFAFIILKEKYELTQIIMGLICLVGVALISQPSFIFDKGEVSQQTDSLDRLKGVVGSILSAFMAALVQVLVKKVKGKSNSGIATIYFGAVSMMFSPLISCIQGIKEVKGTDILPLLIIGVLGFSGQTLRNRAYLFGKAAKVGMVYYFGIAYVYLLDVIVLDTSIDVYSLIGSAFILLCLFFSVIQSLRGSRKAVLP